MRWDPSGKLLASCGDDGTAKIWQHKRDTPLAVLSGHASEINALKWSPTGPQTPHPSLPPRLATASNDGTARIWDAAAGECMRVLQHYLDPDKAKAGEHVLTSLAWAPDGRLLATGCRDGVARVWSVADGMLLKAFRARGEVYDVAWDKEGGRLAVMTLEAVQVLELRY